MGMTSAAEAKLDAKIRPDIAVLRSRTSYPKRHRAFSVVPQDGQRADGPADDGAADAPDESAAAGEPANNVADLVRAAMQARDARQAAAELPPSAPQPETAPARPAPGQPRPAKSAAGDAARRAVPEGPIRLTRRGRIVVGALVVIGVAVGASMLWLIVAGTAQASSHVQPGQAASHALKRLVVRPGQTLWGIAAKADPAADPRNIIHEIIDENSLAGTSIKPGQVLWVPRN